MTYAELAKKDNTELAKLLAEKSEALRTARFSVGRQDAKGVLALRRQISRIQTAIRTHQK